MPAIRAINAAASLKKRGTLRSVFIVTPLLVQKMANTIYQALTRGGAACRQEPIEQI
jgi:hypothetical protein